MGTVNSKDIIDALAKEYPHLRREVIKHAFSVIWEEIAASTYEGAEYSLFKFGVFRFKAWGFPKLNWLTPEQTDHKVLALRFYPGWLLKRRINSHVFDPVDRHKKLLPEDVLHYLQHP